MFSWSVTQVPVNRRFCRYAHDPLNASKRSTDDARSMYTRSRHEEFTRLERDLLLSVLPHMSREIQTQNSLFLKGERRRKVY